MQNFKILVGGNHGILRGTEEKIGCGNFFKKISGKSEKI